MIFKNCMKKKEKLFFLLLENSTVATEPSLLPSSNLDSIEFLSYNFIFSGPFKTLTKSCVKTQKIPAEINKI